MATSKLSTSLTSTCGFHTTSTTHVYVDRLSSLENCSLYLHHTLPPSMIVDPHELLLYKSQYSFTVNGTTNLELPVVGVDSSGSTLLLNVSLPAEVAETPAEIVIELPLHARYSLLASSRISAYHIHHLPSPKGFWACPVSSHIRGELQLLDISQDILPTTDSPPSIFIHIAAVSDVAQGDTFRTPVGFSEDVLDVEIGTAAVILLMFVYLTIVSYKAASSMSLFPSHDKTE